MYLVVVVAFCFCFFFLIYCFEKEILGWSCWKIKGNIRILMLAAASLRWVKSRCVAMGIVAWRFWFESMDSPYVIFMTSSTAAIAVYRGTARRPWLLRSSVSIHRSSILTSGAGKSSPGGIQSWLQDHPEEQAADEARCGPVAIRSSALPEWII